MLSVVLVLLKLSNTFIYIFTLTSVTFRNFLDHKTQSHRTNSLYRKIHIYRHWVENPLMSKIGKNTFWYQKKYPIH